MTELRRLRAAHFEEVLSSLMFSLSRLLWRLAWSFVESSVDFSRWLITHQDLKNTDLSECIKGMFLSVLVQAGYKR